MKTQHFRKTTGYLLFTFILSGLAACGDSSKTSSTAETLIDLNPVLASASGGASGEAGDGNSEDPSISKTGGVIAFQSDATNLVANDTNAKTDVFLRDISKLTTIRVSVDKDGKQLSVASTQPAVSADGRYVAYTSANDPASQIFLFDSQTSTTELVSIKQGGTAEADFSGGNNTKPSVSGDGRYVVFVSAATNLLASGTDANGVADIYLRDTVANTTQRISVSSTGTAAGGASDTPRISSDGDYVVFQSEATNLVSGDSNAKKDVFLHQISKGTTARVSVSSDGTQSNADSSVAFVAEDGAFVMFTSSATNLVSKDTNGNNDVFLYKAADGSVTRISLEPGVGTTTEKAKPSTTGGLADDGRFASLVLQAETGTKGPTQALAIWRASDGRVININPAEAEKATFTIPLLIAEMSADGQYIVIQATSWPLTLNEKSIGEDKQILRVANPIFVKP